MDINLIGVPLTYGCGKDGAQHGPNALRENKIVDLIQKYGHTVYDLGDMSVPEVLEEHKFNGCESIKFLHAVTDVNTNLAHEVFCSLSAGSFPFIMGGDHSLGMGSVAGASKYFDELAVIWIDAHSDINTHLTSPSFNPHGMPLSASMGVGHPNFTDLYYKGQKVKPKNVYIIGVREIDEGEMKLIDDFNLAFYSMETVRERGIDTVLDEVISKIKASTVNAVHLSFDIDVLDSSIVPGTGTPVAGGFTLDEGKYVLETILKEKFVKSMDFVELNPTLDPDSNVTIETCMEILDHTFKYL